MSHGDAKRKILARYMLAWKMDRDRAAHGQPPIPNAARDQAAHLAKMYKLEEYVCNQPTLKAEKPESDFYDLKIGDSYYKFDEDDPEQESIIEVPPPPPLPPDSPRVPLPELPDQQRIVALIDATAQLMAERSRTMAQPQAIVRATDTLDKVSAWVPKRLSDEEIGDALEWINSAPRTAWQIRFKVLTTIFFIMVNAIRETVSALLGKKKGGS